MLERWRRCAIGIGLVSALFCAGTETLLAQNQDYATVLATVNKQTVTRGEVNSLVKKRLGERALNSDQNPDQWAAIQRAALEHLINRRIIQEFLVEKGFAPGKAQVRLEVGKFERKLKSMNESLDSFLVESRMTKEHFQFEAIWRLGWQDYLDDKINDAVLERYYNDHKRQFDGTKMRVSQILKQFTGEPEERSDFEAKAIAELDKARASILAGSLSWRDAASQYSDAPSKTTEGKIGWIGRDGPMAPDFTDAAFKLDTGEISPPVPTQFGVQMIRCAEIATGDRGFRDVYDAVRAAIYKERFQMIADHQRPKVKIVLSKEKPERVR